VNTSDVPKGSSASTTRGRSVKPRWPAQGSPNDSSGRIVSMSIGREIPAPISRFRAEPSGTSTSSARSGWPRLAESPIVRIAGDNARNRASASSTCTPRFVLISSCHSSTTMQRTPASRASPSRHESISDRLSGVVTSTSGRRSRCLRRTRSGVSEQRTSVRQSRPMSFAVVSR
jgi:hypothetical protein